MLHLFLDLMGFLVDLADTVLEFFRAGRRVQEIASDLGLLAAETAAEGVSLLK